jgi:SAM-dependent methyltransferase
MENNFLSVTEIAGDEVTGEQISRLCSRYYWAGSFCANKDVVEVACGTGQGLGYINRLSKTFEAGDYSNVIIKLVKQHYGERIDIKQFDAQKLPFDNKSKDVVILFEALYYLPEAEKFVQECARVLRPSGKVLLATANKDLYDFNPSPHSYKYYGTIELGELFTAYGFDTELFGGFPYEGTSLRQRILRPIKKFVVFLGLMPKTMSGKKFLKKIVFGNLIKMSAEITSSTAEYQQPIAISGDCPDRLHKVIYCAATLKQQ